MKQAVWILGFTAVALATNPQDNPGVDFARLTAHLKAGGLHWEVPVGKDTIRVHRPELKDRLKADYSPGDVAGWRRYLAPALKIDVGPRGMVPAAQRMVEGKKDPTNYDAVWVRDSLWAYLGLSAARDPQAPQVLRFLWDYFASPAQKARAAAILKSPSLIDGADGPMRVLHIRFDGTSPTYDDVHVNGKVQKWNHKQNDALGLWLDLVVRSIRSGEFPASDWTDSRMEAVAVMPAYFEAVRFWRMEDAGSWEEIERVNSSSIGLTVSGLERLEELLRGKTAVDKAAAAKLQAAARRLGVKLTRARVKKLIDRGYARLFRQLAAGGESPIYPRKNPRFRKADAALLNLIYPARLSRLKLSHKERIIALVQPLIGPVGIRRYLEDSYQSGNFWFPRSVTEGASDGGSAGHTDDTSSAEDFAERAKQFIPGSEAQWFFDSWYSRVMGILHRETGRASFRREQVRFFNRAVGQLTGGEPDRLRLGADGRPVPAFALPESYNTVITEKVSYLVPSPITPLNWAKAALALALDSL